MLNDLVSRQIRELESLDLLRHPHVVEPVRGPVVRVDGREFVSFSNNDYLGLASHPALGAAAASVTHEAGWGAGASRLITGTTPWHARIEERMAAHRGREAALFFGSGFLANLGLLTGLGTEEVTYFSDQFNHASVIDGIRLARSRHHVYYHADLDNLRSQIRKHARTPHKVIVTDCVFSMDGDVAPLRELEAVAREFEADLFVDDAHGAGVLGPQGRGTPQHFGVVPHAEIVTLSKAAGSVGGFVVSDRDTVQLLKTRARAFVYSTASPAAVCAAGEAAIDLMEKADDRREKLRASTQYLREKLGRPGETPIIPLILGTTEAALKAATVLWERGYFVPAIRTPTVPRDAARLRISVTALHEREHLDGLIDALGQI